MINVHTKFLIVGLGLIGGSYAKGLMARGYYVSAIDISSESIQFALANKFIISGSSTNDVSLIEDADVIIMGLYPSAMVTWLKEHQKYIKANSLITDVSGVKQQVVSAIQQFLRPDLEFIGAHPMAGKEVSGVQHSDSRLFLPANLIITPTEKNTQDAILMVRDLGHILRFERISILSPDRHDKMIGFLSQLTHVIAVCLMNIHESDHLVAYTGDSFRDLTRIAKINENLWSELFLLNKDVLLEEIDSFMNELSRFRSVLVEEDVEQMKKLFVQSTARRKAFDK